MTSSSSRRGGPMISSSSGSARAPAGGATAVMVMPSMSKSASALHHVADLGAGVEQRPVEIALGLAGSGGSPGPRPVGTGAGEFDVDPAWHRGPTLPERNARRRMVTGRRSTRRIGRRWPARRGFMGAMTILDGIPQATPPWRGGAPLRRPRRRLHAPAAAGRPRRRPLGDPQQVPPRHARCSATSTPARCSPSPRAGAWKYAEYPEVNRAGSYLFEPAGSIHTLTVLEDNTERDRRLVRHLRRQPQPRRRRQRRDGHRRRHRPRVLPGACARPRATRGPTSSASEPAPAGGSPGRAAARRRSSGWPGSSLVVVNVVSVVHQVVARRATAGLDARPLPDRPRRLPDRRVGVAPRRRPLRHHATHPGRARAAVHLPADRRGLPGAADAGAVRGGHRRAHAPEHRRPGRRCWRCSSARSACPDASCGWALARGDAGGAVHRAGAGQPQLRPGEHPADAARDARLPAPTHAVAPRPARRCRRGHQADARGVRALLPRAPRPPLGPQRAAVVRRHHRARLRPRPGTRR